MIINRLAVACVTIAGIVAGGAASAQKAGGVLEIYHRDNPPSASILEEATTSTVVPFMAIYNNLVIFDQNNPVNSLDDIVPDLGKSWKWSEDRTDLTFQLQEGVKWHDGKPFTAADVKCTFDLIMGKDPKRRLRKNPRDSWYTNLDSVTTEGDYQATIHLKRPQPAFLSLLASGYSPMYPCHVSPEEMRTHPIGTGPFKFDEMAMNQYIKLSKNENYWKKGRPYLDGIQYTIIKSRSTRILAFIAGNFDMTWPADVTIPLLKDVTEQAPDRHCETVTTTSRNVIVNRHAPPFDDPEIRKAFAPPWTARPSSTS